MAPNQYLKKFDFPRVFPSKKSNFQAANARVKTEKIDQHHFGDAPSNNLPNQPVSDSNP